MLPNFAGITPLALIMNWGFISSTPSLSSFPSFNHILSPAAHSGSTVLNFAQSETHFVVQDRKGANSYASLQMKEPGDKKWNVELFGVNVDLSQNCNGLANSQLVTVKGKVDSGRNCFKTHKCQR